VQPFKKDAEPATTMTNDRAVFHAKRSETSLPGTNVMILKNIFAKKLAKNLAFLDQNKAKLC
jgi:hypothetical protein